ncbi:uncharacterized protein A4U43_C01F31380 [Asparagus officinalis]|uniref:Cytochrome P450 n=1 Tax=Asparagus officinalis TaxID=4686 RepID=A0A5P1FX39_ASPOF|nr:cytochrome P450 71A1-like [Asparagus officinalis]ONK81640.1 uncharacterized protein A4U43_C01F31380 [Asparagus officinalis]
MKHLVYAVQPWPLFLTTITFMFTLLLFFFKLSKKKDTSNLPPSPPKLPVIGNLHQLGSLAHRSLQALSEKYGPIMLLQLGSVPTVVVSSAEMACKIMKTHDLIFASRPPLSMTKRLLYDSDVAFTPYGEYWRQVRRVCVVHLLSLKRVQSFRLVREEEVSLLVEKIRESCNGVVNLSEMLLNLTNNVICRVALRRKYFGEEGEGYNFSEMLKEFICLLGSFPVGDFIPWLGWIDLLSGLDARVTKNFRELDGFLERVLDDHLHDKGTSSNDEEDRSFVEVLLSLDEKDDMAGISLSRDNLKAIILDMFSAGTDTTYTVIEWAMAELIKNPKAMKRVQEEVRGVTGGKRKITEENIDRMKYLKAVIKETLRMHPPIPLLIPRESMEDVELQGYHIPAGTRVIMNGWAIGRDPKSWDKPREFYPERFGSYDVDFKGQDFRLIPFGAGRRGCPGIGFGMATIELTLAHLLNHFDWGFSDGMKEEVLDMRESPGFVAHKASSLVLIAKPRFA